MRSAGVVLPFMHRKCRFNDRGVNTIIAALLMVLIVMIASVIVYSWSIGIFGSILPPPAGGKENLIVENQGFDAASMNMTLYVRNLGSAPSTLVSYYVQDLSGNAYARTSWTAGSIPQTGLGRFYILINSACGNSCKLTGSGFNYQTGNTYVLTLVTQRNNQFSFTILR